MENKHIETIAEELKVKAVQVANTLKLLEEGNTVPFIARYRKEMTGSCDDQVLRDIYDRLVYLRNLEKRKQEVISSITEQGKITDEITETLLAAETLAAVEDIYRPYKPKRKTKASIAKEKGLEPLALRLLEQNANDDPPEKIAAEFVNEEKAVTSIEDALKGANDIIAEIVSDDASVRKGLKELIQKEGLIKSVSAKEEDSVYSMYYDYSEAVAKQNPRNKSR